MSDEDIRIARKFTLLQVISLSEPVFQVTKSDCCRISVVLRLTVICPHSGGRGEHMEPEPFRNSAEGHVPEGGGRRTRLVYAGTYSGYGAPI